jgi:PTS system glucitol/sorbitol-specific IIC component
MELLASWAQAFIGIFNQGGAVFTSLVTGIVPTLIVLMTAVNALIALIGPERIDNIGRAAGKEGFAATPLRYLVLPVISCFFLTNPMAYTMGRFLPEKYKPAFYDAAVSFVHPPLGIFPHINPGELFVWAGIAEGVRTAAGDAKLASLALGYLLTGLVVIYMRGLVTEYITSTMWKKSS